MTENGLFEIMELVHAWHNAKMTGKQYTEPQIIQLRQQIIKLAKND